MAKKYTGSNEGQETVEASGLEIDDGTLHVDAANNKVGIGTKTPTGNLTIDHDLTATATDTVRSLHIDFDATGITASGQTATNIGLDLDMNSQVPTMVGTVANTGIDMDIVGGTSGTQTNIGLDVVVSGADTNIPIRIEGGGYQMKETTTPTATADYGQVYTKTDNLLYFQDGAGVERKVTEEVICLSCSDETTNLTTGNAKVTFHMPFAMTLTAVKATVTTAPAGSTIIVDINEAGSTILSTKLSIDASEKTSSSAASAAVISDASLANDALMTIDIDQIGSGTAGTGLKVWLTGYRA